MADLFAGLPGCPARCPMGGICRYFRYLSEGSPTYLTTGLSEQAVLDCAARSRALPGYPGRGGERAETGAGTPQNDGRDRIACGILAGTGARYPAKGSPQKAPNKKHSTKKLAHGSRSFFCPGRFCITPSGGLHRSDRSAGERLLLHHAVRREGGEAAFALRRQEGQGTADRSTLSPAGVSPTPLSAWFSRGARRRFLRKRLWRAPGMQSPMLPHERENGVFFVGEARGRVASLRQGRGTGEARGRGTAASPPPRLP